MANKNGAHVIIREEQFKSMALEQQTWIMYTTLKSVEERVYKLERQKMIRTACSSIGGVIGGFLAFIAVKVGIRWFQ
jgi:hypothetical protein